MATRRRGAGERKGRRGGGGRESDQNGFKGCLHTIGSQLSARMGREQRDGKGRINFKLR